MKRVLFEETVPLGYTSQIAEDQNFELEKPPLLIKLFREILLTDQTDQRVVSCQRQSLKTIASLFSIACGYINNQSVAWPIGCISAYPIYNMTIHFHLPLFHFMKRFFGDFIKAQWNEVREF